MPLIVEDKVYTKNSAFQLSSIYTVYVETWVECGRDFCFYIVFSQSL